MRVSVIWLKLVSLAVLTGILYWRDLPALAETVSSVEQVGFTVVIASFVVFSLYKKREALERLASLSEMKATQGSLLLILALCLYVWGSYTPWSVWLHHASLIVFMAGYLSLTVDHRIPRLMIAAFVVSLFLVPLPIEARILESLSLSSLVGFAVIGTLLTLFFDIPNRWNAAAASAGMVLFIAFAATGIELASIFSPIAATSLIVLSFFAFRKVMGSKTIRVPEPCSLCESGWIEEAFCPHCGRQLIYFGPTLEKHSVLKQVVLFVMVVVLSSATMPVLYLGVGEVTIRSFGAWGIEEGLAVPTPNLWLLNSSERLGILEGEYEEELVLKNIYVAEEPALRDAYILYLEIGTVEPYIARLWRYLPDWKKTWPPDSIVLFGEAPPGDYLVLEKGGKAMIVLTWTTRLLFMSDSIFVERRVGASVVMNLTGRYSQTSISQTAEKLRAVFEPTATRWAVTDQWTRYAQAAKDAYGQFTPLTISVVAIGGAFALVLRARREDSDLERRVERAMSLSHEDKLLLSAIFRARRRKLTLNGRNIFHLYKEKIKCDLGIDRFYEKMSQLLNQGIVRKVLFTRGSRVTMEWRLTIWPFPSLGLHIQRLLHGVWEKASR